MHQRHHGYNKLRQQRPHKASQKKHTFCYLLFIDLIICNAVIILIAYVCQYRQCYTYSRITEYCIGFGLLILHCICRTCAIANASTFFSFVRSFVATVAVGFVGYMCARADELLLFVIYYPYIHRVGGFNHLATATVSVFLSNSINNH